MTIPRGPVNTAICVKSCRRDALNGANRAVRETWGVQLVPLFFFGDDGQCHEPDEVPLVCDDSYLALPGKTRAILRWLLASELDYAFLCDTDTLVFPDRLLASGFERYDLTGRFNGPIGTPSAVDGGYAWISGSGYWISRRAAEVVLNAPFKDWAEDRMVGHVLGPFFGRRVLRGFDHKGYAAEWDAPVTDATVTIHYCSEGRKRSFHPDLMRQKWAEVHS